MNALGIIFTYSEFANLREISDERTMASVSFAGRYRLIDFAMSNFVNSGIFNIALITKDSYNSLIDHVGIGTEWDLDRKRGGLSILTPYGGAATGGIYRGKVDALSSHMKSIKSSMAEYVILASSSLIYSVDYREMIEHHKATGADITMAYTRNAQSCENIPLGAPIFTFDHENRMTDIYLNEDESCTNPVNLGMGIFVMRKSLLEALVADAMSYGRYDIYTGLIRKQLNALRIMGYEYTGNLMLLASVTNYMQANMSLLDPQIREQVFENTIYTKIKDSVPVEYGPQASVKNSIIADGCIIEGTVENCIISRGVRIGRGSVIKDSIIMEYTTILENSELDYVIIDKDVIVRNSSQISGHITFPVVIKKGSII